jgi:hypothetical protein
VTHAAQRPRADSFGWNAVQIAGFLAPPVLWSAHLLLSYLLISVGCTMGTAWMRVVLGVVTALILAGIALATVGAFVVSEMRGERWWPRDDAEPGRAGFMSHFGVFCGVLFFVATLFTAAPIYSLSTC